ncbi:TrbC family F-type conjugative pilus assembly protein [Aliarcobacter cryaerophilus]|uniref:TrbC family F-type conjugative pilus assembly protein n=1 Tax=Aliarcobacter cryaerophilus TaxID=28198 RepID=UPI003DA57156
MINKKILILLVFITSTLLFSSDKFEAMKKLENNVYLQSQSIDLKGIQKNFNSHDFTKNLSNVYDNALKNVDIETRRIQGENVSIDNFTILKNTNVTFSEENLKSFLKNNRIYIFMSESVPMSIWHTYGKLMHDKKLSNTSMVLRGCIGGNCKNIGPTGEFIVNLRKYDINNEINPNVIIDPLLFRKYNIEKAPCVVFAENVQTKVLSQSEGNDENFNAKNTYKSCGAWDLVWHLKEIQKNANSLELEQIIKYLEPKASL